MDDDEEDDGGSEINLDEDDIDSTNQTTERSEFTANNLSAERMIS